MEYYKLLNVFFFLFLATTSGSDGLKNVRISQPQDFLRYGEDAQLTCDYDLEKVSLYAIKWYRNNQEFYRFVPKEVPPQQSFPNQHINVSTINSNDRSVHVHNVSFDFTGKFKCVVTAETNFQTFQDSRDMIVVAIGHTPPVLQKDRETYLIGDEGALECSLEKVSSLVKVSWFVNERLENRSDVVIVSKIQLNPSHPHFYKILSKFSFNVSSFLPFKIRCEMQLGQIYAQSTSVIIQPVARPATTTSTTSPQSILFPSSPTPPQQFPHLIESSNSKFNSTVTLNKKYFQELQSSPSSTSAKSYSEFLFSNFLFTFTTFFTWPTPWRNCL